MSTVATEAIELSAIEQRTSDETWASDQSRAASLDGSTLQVVCTSDSDTTDSSTLCQSNLNRVPTQHEDQVDGTNTLGASSNPILQFLLKTWLGNVLAIIALLVAIASLGMTAYSSVLQAVAAKWSMRNDAFQSCLSASTLNMSTRYCNDLLVDGFEAPPGILRRRRDPSELRKTGSDHISSEFDPYEFLRKVNLPGHFVWPCALLVTITAALSILVVSMIRIYSREQRRDVILSVARMPACTFLGGLAGSTWLSTSEHIECQWSGEKQPSCWDERVTILKKSLENEIEDEEWLHEDRDTQFLTKIGVSYYSEDESDDSDDDFADKVLHLPSNNPAEQKDEHNLDEDFSSPASPHEVAIWFEADAKALRDIIMNATTTCKTFDRNGAEISPELSDSFCADKDLFQVLSSQRSFIKRLFVEAKQAQMSVNKGDSYDESSRIVQDAIAKAEAFFDGVLLRTKAFAILISTCVSPSSEMWARFEQDCFLPESERSSASFTNNLLPFDLETAKLRLGNDYECFYSRQWHFCPLKLVEGSAVEYSHPEDCLRLPFLEKHYSSLDSLWTMTHAKLKDDPFNTGRKDASISLKRLQYTSERWESIQDVIDSNVAHKHLANARMALKTGDHIYVFFDVGTYTLYNYITKARPSGPLNFTGVKAHFRSMHGIAEALKYLYHHPDPQRLHPVNPYVDVRAEDILVDVSDSMATLRLAYPVFAESRCSSVDENESLDVRTFGLVFAHYVAWLWGGLTGLRNVEASIGYSTTGMEGWSQSPSPFRMVLFERWLSDVIKELYATGPPEERLFYESVLWLFKNHLLVDGARQTNGLRGLCSLLNQIQDCILPDKVRTPEPTSKAVPLTGAEGPAPTHSPSNNTPSGWRRRLPWSRRQASTA